VPIVSLFVFLLSLSSLFAFLSCLLLLYCRFFFLSSGHCAATGTAGGCSCWHCRFDVFWM